MQLVFINECKSCEISNQMFFNVMFSFLKVKDDWIWHKYWKNKTSGTILHGASTEPMGYQEPSQTFTREYFCKKESSKKAKELHCRCSAWF